MLELNVNISTTEDGRYFDFTNRGTDYTITRNKFYDNSWDVWTSRRSLHRSLSVKVVHEKDMKTKVLKEFLEIVDVLEEFEDTDPKSTDIHTQH